MIEGVDYYIRFVRFPNRSTPGQVWLNDDGSYDIYIDERLSKEESVLVFIHELKHISADHFNCTQDIRSIEQEAG